MSPSHFVDTCRLMSTGSIPSILAYPQCGYHLVCHTGLSLVHCSYLSVGSLQPGLAFCTVGKLLASFTVGDMASGLSVEVRLRFGWACTSDGESFA